MEKSAYTFTNPFIAGQNLIIPSSLKFLARREFKRITNEPSNSNISYKKGESSLESFLTRQTTNTITGQMPSYALCGEISAQPFWEAADSPLLEVLENTFKKNAEDIYNEYQLAVTKQNGHLTQNIKTGERFLKQGSWENFALGSLGRYSKLAKELFPITVGLLQHYGKRIVSAEFIVMEEDTLLPPHTDATNIYLAAHLGLKVADNCGIQVKNKVRELHQGDWLCFDQSFVHSAWNKGESQRVNLLITFFHPEINDDEIELLLKFITQLKRKVILFSPIIILEYAFLKLKSLIT